MNISAIRRRGVSVLLVAGMPALVSAEMEISPRHFGSSTDVGQIIEGRSGNDGRVPVKNQPIARTGAGFGLSASYDKKFDINLGMGGLFWYPLPQDLYSENLGNGRDKLLLFGFGVGQAEGVYKFGNPESPSATFHMGLFGHKYNPDAKNLGEYLFRSGTYPGYVWTGGWSYLNSASYLAQGFLLTVPTMGGVLTHDFALYVERNFAPTHDLSPAYLMTLKPSSAIEFGAGVVWTNGLSFKGSKVLSPKIRMNAYDRNTKFPLSISDRGAPGYNRGSPFRISYADSLTTAYVDPFSGLSVTWKDAILGGYRDPATQNRYVWDVEVLGDGISNPTNYNGTPNSALDYYTFKGFKAMARASLTFGEAKVYGEWAWLGIQNQPYFYDKPLERMPVMLGASLPTFGILEAFSIEVDYRKSPFKNTLTLAWDRLLPEPLNGESDEPLFYRPEGRDHLLAGYGDTTGYATTTAEIDKSAKENAWHWSVYAKRKITEGVSLTAQVASDHMRHFSIVFGTPNGMPATQRTKDWYYVLRLEFGI